MYSESLVDLCLETIVDNFPRYNSVFNTTKDDSMKRRFEFLQRKYSFEILSRLSTKGGSLEEYVDLLINKYLKVLDTSWLRNCSWEKVTSKIAEIGCNIEKLCFNHAHFVEETPWQDIIGCFPNLKCFIFYESCKDLVLKHIAIFCPNIQEIYLKGISSISSEGVKYLCKNENGEALCTKLKKLYLEYTYIALNDVKYLLKNLPSLETIDYRDLPLVLYSLHKNDLSSLAKVKPYNIISLDLSYCAFYPSYSNIRKVCLSVCPNLKHLSYSLLKNDELNFFPKLPYLEKLYLECVSSSKINVNELLKNVSGKLTSLSITNCTLSVSVLAESCPHIKVLEMNKVRLLVDGNSRPILNCLSSFKFENSDISKSANAISLLLSSSEKLGSLTFETCNLLPFEIKAAILKCCEMYPIKELSFCDSVIEKDYIKELLLNCPTLSCLNISGCLNMKHENILLKFAEILPNKPKIICDHETDSDSEDDYYYNYGAPYDDDISFPY